jgi:hypothetical protein
MARPMPPLAPVTIAALSVNWRSITFPCPLGARLSVWGGRGDTCRRRALSEPVETKFRTDCVVDGTEIRVHGISDLNSGYRRLYPLRECHVLLLEIVCFASINEPEDLLGTFATTSRFAPHELGACAR